MVVNTSSGVVVEVDMSGVEFIDSSGFGALIRAQARLDVEGRHLRVVNVPDRIRGLMETLGLVDFLDAFGGGSPEAGHHS